MTKQSSHSGTLGASSREITIPHAFSPVRLSARLRQPGAALPGRCASRTMDVFIEYSIGDTDRKLEPALRGLMKKIDSRRSSKPGFGRYPEHLPARTSP